MEAEKKNQMTSSKTFTNSSLDTLLHDFLLYLRFT